MKPREKGGVVDTRLNVYGVQGLKVADMSIAPSNVATVSLHSGDTSDTPASHLDMIMKNTYSTAITIGEKAATIIAEDLGIRGV